MKAWFSFRSLFVLCLGLAIGGLVTIAALLTSPDRLSWLIGQQWRFSNQPPVTQTHLELASFALKARGVPSPKPGHLWLYGDSHLHGLHADQLLATGFSSYTNWAVGGLSAASLVQHLNEGRLAPPPADLQAVLLHLGHNDLGRGADGQQVLEQLRKLAFVLGQKRNLYLVELVPMGRRSAPQYGEANWNMINQGLPRLCEELLKQPTNQPLSCSVISLNGLGLESNRSRLKPSYEDADGIHLSPAGYEQLGRILSAQIASMKR